MNCWLLEHEPVYTIGRTPDQSSLRGATHLPHPLFEINRGGQATYHGPGQLVGYFLLDLRRYGQDLHRYLRWIEALLIELLAQYGIKATTRAGLTGVWVERIAKDRLDRRRRAALDHDARFCAQRRRRSVAFRPDHAVRDRECDDDFDRKGNWRQPSSGKRRGAGWRNRPGNESRHLAMLIGVARNASSS